MKKLVVLLMVSLMATSAFAQIDPDPNGIGVYFDTGASVTALEIGPSIPFFAYVAITNPEFQVAGAEFGYNIVVPAGMEGMIFRLAEILPTQAINLGNSVDKLSGDYVVGTAAPIPAAAVVNYITWQFMLLAPTTMEFYITPSVVPALDPPVPAYEIGGSILPLQQSSGGPDAPVACVNSCTPVATENASFGSVKSLFR